MEPLTIITPTYNRADLIVNLYKSLENQTNKHFCWMIVDDGSADNTFEVVQRLKGNASFEIVYLRKTNGGKHTALNFGIKEIDTELTFIVDSDDTLANDAVQSILDVHERYKPEDRISSYTFLRGADTKSPIVPIERNEFIENYIIYRIKNNRPGDMAEVYKTKFLKQFPFPVFLGEKFISEDVVWIEIGKVSDSVYINKVIYICEYLQGGLTSNDKKMKFSSPIGSMMRGKQLMSKECGLKANIKGAIIYNVYSKEAKMTSVNNEIDLNFREHALCTIIGVLTDIFYRKWHEGF